MQFCLRCGCCCGGAVETDQGIMRRYGRVLQANLNKGNFTGPDSPSGTKPNDLPTLTTHLLIKERMVLYTVKE